MVLQKENFNLSIADADLLKNHTVERRTKPRIAIRFSVLVRGVDETGEAFVVPTILENLSVNGLYLQLPRTMSEGARVSIDIKLALGAVHSSSGPRVAVEGVVSRIDPKPNGMVGLAVIITKHKFH